MKAIEQEPVAEPRPAKIQIEVTPLSEEEQEFFGQIEAATSSAPVGIIQPDPNGEFPTPLDRAIWTLETEGIAQVLLHGKEPFESGWTKKGIRTVEQLRAQAALHPGCNFGSLAEKGKHFVFEVDSAEVRKRFEAIGGKFTAKYAVQSSSAERGHRWYRWVDGIENVSQEAVKYSDFSIRVDGEQAVSPGSVHPTTGKQYRVIAHGPLTAPTKEEIEFWKSERTKSKVNASPSGTPIECGTHDTTLFKIACKMRSIGMEEQGIKDALLEVAEKRLVSPGSDWKDMVAAKAIQACKYPPGTDASLILSNTPQTTQTTQVSVSTVPGSTFTMEGVPDDLQWLDTSTVAKRPVFPLWVLQGTSLHTDLAKPVSDANSKYPEMIWLPAVQLFLNYLYNKVQIKMLQTKTNMFLGIISEAGKFFKSSSCEVGHKYFESIGVAHNHTGNFGALVKDKVIITQGGSSEGFGRVIKKLSGTNAIFYNDELAKLVSKASIENSSLSHDILTWYESGRYESQTKNDKTNFVFDPGSYCFGWQFCTTTKGFNFQWPKIAKLSSGMLDRMFFLLSPLDPKPSSPETFVPLDATRTKELLDRAVAQGVYEIGMPKDMHSKSAIFDNPRTYNLVQKFALYFTVDLDREELDEDAIERAVALVQYREDAVKFLEPIEAGNEDARLEQEIKRELRQNAGKLNRRLLGKNLNESYYGDYLWNRVYNGLRKSGKIREFKETSPAGQKMNMVGLVKEEIWAGPLD